MNLIYSRFIDILKLVTFEQFSTFVINRYTYTDRKSQGENEYLVDKMKVKQGVVVNICGLHKKYALYLC